MYCRRCYTDLREARTTGFCPYCSRKFDPARPRTYLKHPFPSKRKIIFHLILTTAVGIAAAFVVALHQSAQASGH